MESEELEDHYIYFRVNGFRLFGVDKEKDDVLEINSHMYNRCLSEKKWYTDPNIGIDITYEIRPYTQPYVVGMNSTTTDFRLRIGPKVFKQFGRYYVYENTNSMGEWVQI